MVYAMVSKTIGFTSLVGSTPTFGTYAAAVLALSSLAGAALERSFSIP